MLFRAKLFIIFGIPVIAAILTLFIFRIYHIEGPSMEPIFKDGQRILVQKWDRTYESIRGRQYIPNRFDVVVIRPPDGGPQVIKRVIGLPGERIVISAGTVLVVNNEHQAGYFVDKDIPIGAIDLNEETEGKVNLVLGKDEVYVLGDNRNHSEDSRLFGPVKTNDIVGKYWSF